MNIFNWLTSLFRTETDSEEDFMNTKFIKQTSHAFEFYDASSTIERIGRGIYIKNSSGKPVPISYEQVKHLGTSLLKSH